MKIQRVSFIVQGIFFNEVVRTYRQGNKSLINRVGRSLQGYISFSLFRIDLPSVGQYRRAAGNIFLR